MFLQLATVALVFSADPKPTNENSTMKTLVKDAISQKSKGPDVSKMPFTPDSVKAVVAANQPLIQGCYEEQLALKKKAVDGTLKTSIVITADGLVTKARVNKAKSSLKESRLHDCVVAVLSGMEFPKPPDGKDHPVDIPFNLTAKH
jgi:hypothetical protein